MTAPVLHLVVPGPLDQKTGGYLYDARIVAGLRDRGRSVVVHNLQGEFPHADDTARTSFADTLSAIPDGSTVVLDGLAMGGVPEPVREHGGRLRLISLVHHLLADETGLTDHDRARFETLERDGLSHCAGVIVTSAYTAGRVARYGVPEARIRSVLPGTEREAGDAGSSVGSEAPGAVGSPRAEPRERAGRVPTLLCVGSVTPRKGYDVLVAALATLSDLDWTCVCAGALDRAPEHARDVLRSAEEAGIAGRMDFIGEVDPSALRARYRDATLFVLASHFEGYGMALAEALAHGLPVVSTTGGAIPHTVPTEAGLLVEPGDASAFAEAVRSVLTDPARLDELGAGARRHAERLPTWEQAAEEFEAAVEALSG